MQEAKTEQAAPAAEQAEPAAVQEAKTEQAAEQAEPVAVHEAKLVEEATPAAPAAAETKAQEEAKMKADAEVFSRLFVCRKARLSRRGRLVIPS